MSTNYNVHINDASAKQLKSLLNLSDIEVNLIVRQRPFRSASHLRESLPQKTNQKIKSDLQIMKQNINLVEKSFLVDQAKISATVADEIIYNRPYFYLAELSSVPGMDPDAFNSLLSLCSIPTFNYKDKTSGRQVELLPQADEFLLQVRETEADTVEKTIADHKLLKRYSQESQMGFIVCAAPEFETASSTVSKLKKAEGIEAVTPSFKDNDGIRRYVALNRCYVQFAEGVDRNRQLAILTTLGLTVEIEHRTVGLYTVYIPNAKRNPTVVFDTIETLNAFDDVKIVEPYYMGFDDLEDTGPEILDETTSTPPWNFSVANFNTTRTITEGSPAVIIAVIDSGIAEQIPGLSTSILPRAIAEDWDFSSDGSLIPTDEHGHGTFIAGILAGSGIGGIHGICPNCKILPLKLALTASFSDYARRRDAILYAIKSIPTGLRLVINLSWKTTGDIALIRDAVNMAHDSGAIIVASAGNYPSIADQPHYPSDYLPVISVAGADAKGKLAGYSFYGEDVDVLAPGGTGMGDSDSDVRSYDLSGDIRSWFGTSFAAPHVAGLSALIWSIDQTLTAHRVREIIETTCRSTGDYGVGHGLIDIDAAVQLTKDSRQPTDDSISTSRPSLGMKFLNEATLDELVTKFGLARITARIIIDRRPILRVTDLQYILGMSDGQYQTILSFVSGEQQPTVSPAHAQQTSVNSASFTRLLTVPGMLSFSARLILALRPFANLTEVQTISGITDEIMSYLTI